MDTAYEIVRKLPVRDRFLRQRSKTCRISQTNMGLVRLYVPTVCTEEWGRPIGSEWYFLPRFARKQGVILLTEYSKPMLGTIKFHWMPRRSGGGWLSIHGHLKANPDFLIFRKPFFTGFQVVRLQEKHESNILLKIPDMVFTSEPWNGWETKKWAERWTTENPSIIV